MKNKLVSMHTCSAIFTSVATFICLVLDAIVQSTNISNYIAEASAPIHNFLTWNFGISFTYAYMVENSFKTTGCLPTKTSRKHCSVLILKNTYFVKARPV